MILLTGDSEQIPIRPKEFQLKGPSETSIVFDNASHTSTIDESENTILDMQYGFWLSEDDKDALRQQYRGLAPDDRIINQTQALFTKDVPTFVDFKLKRDSVEDPKFQLAVWGAGLYLKRKHHKWDVSMPIIGVTIESHIWQCFLLFESGDKLVKALLLVFKTPTDCGFA